MRISLKWVLLAGVIGLLVISVSIILASSYLTSQKVLSGHARDIMENIATFTIKESQHYLNPAQDAAQLTEKLAFSDVVNNRQTDKLERYFYEQLQLHGSFAGIYIGFVNGEFFYVNRSNVQSPGGFRTKIISFEKEVRRTKLIWRDSKMGALGEEWDTRDTYDPRQRPWYRDASRTHQTVWTDPYIFYTSQKPGLTVASPVYDPNGELMGVVGVDIEIDEISRFLSRLKVGKHGRAFILTTNGDLVAFPDLTKIRSPAGDSQDSFRLARIDELGDILALKAYQSLAQQVSGLTGNSRVFGSFTDSGHNYHTMFAPFTNSQWPWLIGIYLPEDDYLGSLKANLTKNIYIMLAIAVLGSFIGFFFVKGIVRSMAALQKEAQAVQAYDLDTTYEKKSPIREIQAAVDSFAQMKIGLAEYQRQNVKLAETLKIRAGELKTKEMQLRSTLTTLVNFTDALIVLDKDHRIMFLNPKAEELLAMRSNAVLGQPFVFPVSPGPKTEIEIEVANDIPMIAEMQVVDTEWEGDGAFLVALRDITPRIQMEKEIKWRTDTLQILHETALALSGRKTMAELYEAIAVRVVASLDCKGVWIFSWDDAQETLRGVWNFRLQPDIVDRQALVAYGLFDRVMSEGRSLLEEKCNASRFPGLIGENETVDFDQCIATPLIWGSRTLGIMVAGRNRGQAFSGKDVVLLEQFGPLAAAAMDQNRLLIEAEGFYRRAEEDARTKSVLLKEINHRVKNNLASIIGLLYAEKNHNPARKQADFQDALDGVIHQIQGLATVHDLLNAADWRPLPLGELVDKVIQSALLVLPRNKEINVHITPASIGVAPVVATSLAMIVNECATNTTKYALTGRHNGRIDVQINLLDKDRLVELIHRDDGPGYPADVLRFKRYNTGLYLLKNIVELELNGRLTLLNDNGAVTRFLFQLDPNENGADQTWSGAAIHGMSDKVKPSIDI